MKLCSAVFLLFTYKQYIKSHYMFRQFLSHLQVCAIGTNKYKYLSYLKYKCEISHLSEQNVLANILTNTKS
jgi:hypothetical protein